MTLSVARFLLIFVVGLTVGCQSMGRQRTAAVSHTPNTIQTVKADAGSTTSGPIILLSGDLQPSEGQATAESPDQSLWSKLSKPTRFLLPRTDTEPATTLETPQGLDDGF